MEIGIEGSVIASLYLFQDCWKKLPSGCSMREEVDFFCDTRNEWFGGMVQPGTDDARRREMMRSYYERAARLRELVSVFLGGLIDGDPLL